MKQELEEKLERIIGKLDEDLNKINGGLVNIEEELETIRKAIKNIELKYTRE